MQAYPHSWEEFVGWFQGEEDCRDYLDWLRWPNGFVCPTCGVAGKGWRRTDGRWDCGECKSIATQTAGTVLDRTRTPLMLWFAAAWHLTNQKHGISAIGLCKELRLGSHQTSWHMLHRLRAGMVRAERPKLSGDVEVDETYVGGVMKPGKGGRGAAGKTLVAIAVELESPKKLGRCRLSVVPNAGKPALQGFIRDNVEAGSVVITDAWPSYAGLDAAGEYNHKVFNLSDPASQPHTELPGVHRIASLLKRWLLGTHQGAVSPEHLQAYLEEFTFRFNRRHSRRRGMLFYRLLQGCVAAPPLPYKTLVKINRRNASGKSPVPPVAPQLTRIPFEPTHRPWRA